MSFDCYNAKLRKKQCSSASLAAPSEKTANVESYDDYFNRDSILTSSDPIAERSSTPETSPKDARHDHMQHVEQTIPYKYIS